MRLLYFETIILPANLFLDYFKLLPAECDPHHKCAEGVECLGGGGENTQAMCMKNTLQYQWSTILLSCTCRLFSTVSKENCTPLHWFHLQDVTWIPDCQGWLLQKFIMWPTHKYDLWLTLVVKKKSLLLTVPIYSQQIRKTKKKMYVIYIHVDVVMNSSVHQVAFLYLNGSSLLSLFVCFFLFSPCLSVSISFQLIHAHSSRKKQNKSNFTYNTEEVKLTSKMPRSL